jgi:hypothetical protein
LPGTESKSSKQNPAAVRSPLSSNLPPSGLLSDQGKGQKPEEGSHGNQADIPPQWRPNLWGKELVVHYQGMDRSDDEIKASHTSGNHQEGQWKSQVDKDTSPPDER